jgi:hypothetical protein
VRDRCLLKAGAPSLQLHAPSGKFDCGRTEVDARVPRPCPHEPHAIRRDATARFEYVLVRPGLELDEFWDVRFECVAMRLDLREEIRRADRRIGGTKARLILGPELVPRRTSGDKGRRALVHLPIPTRVSPRLSGQCGISMSGRRWACGEPQR